MQKDARVGVRLLLLRRVAPENLRTGHRANRRPREIKWFPLVPEHLYSIREALGSSKVALFFGGRRRRVWWSWNPVRWRLERSGRGGVGEAPISRRAEERSLPPPPPPSPGMGSCDCPREAELGARRYPGYRLAAWKGARSVVRKLGDGKRALV